MDDKLVNGFIGFYSRGNIMLDAPPVPRKESYAPLASFSLLYVRSRWLFLFLKTARKCTLEAHDWPQAALSLCFTLPPPVKCFYRRGVEINPRPTGRRRHFGRRALHLEARGGHAGRGDRVPQGELRNGVRAPARGCQVRAAQPCVGCFWSSFPTHIVFPRTTGSTIRLDPTRIPA